VQGNGLLTTSAASVAADIAGTELGHEFLNKLEDASAVFFMGGNQWPYVQLLQTDTTAAGLISDGNNNGKTAVGGTSAGLAILGNYVYTAQYAQGGQNLTSQDIMTNYTTPLFNQAGSIAIANQVLTLNALSGFITDTHLGRSDQFYTVANVRYYNYFRLGRLLTFMGAIDDPEDSGFGQSQALGIGIQENGAITVSGAGGTGKVFGEDALFAETASTPFVHSSVNASGAVNDALQLDLQTVDVRWFSPGDEFEFVGPGIVDRSSEGGTTAQVSMVNGNISIVAGSLPF
jgi:cyanophycinase-like exopeptidase